MDGWHVALCFHSTKSCQHHSKSPPSTNLHVAVAPNTLNAIAHSIKLMAMRVFDIRQPAALVYASARGHQGVEM
jgi:hypothetical protein